MPFVSSGSISVCFERPGRKNTLQPLAEGVSSPSAVNGGSARQKYRVHHRSGSSDRSGVTHRVAFPKRPMTPALALQRAGAHRDFFGHASTG